MKQKTVVKTGGKAKERAGLKFEQPKNFGPVSKAFKICKTPKTHKCFKVGEHRFAEIPTLQVSCAKGEKAYGGTNSRDGIEYHLQKAVVLGPQRKNGSGKEINGSYTYIIK